MRDSGCGTPIALYWTFVSFQAGNSKFTLEDEILLLLGHTADLLWSSDQSSPLPGYPQVLSKYLLNQPEASFQRPLCSSFDGALRRVCGFLNLKNLLTSTSDLRINYMIHEKIYYIHRI